MDGINAWEVNLVNVTIHEKDETIEPETTAVMFGQEVTLNPESYNYTVVYSVQFHSPNLDQIDSRYKRHTAKLTASIMDGNFTDLLQFYALQQGSEVMATGVTNTPPLFAVASVFDPNADSSGNGNTVVDNTAVLACIILGGLLFCICCLYCTNRLRGKYLKEKEFTQWVVSGQDVMTSNSAGPAIEMQPNPISSNSANNVDRESSMYPGKIDDALDI